VANRQTDKTLSIFGFPGGVRSRNRGRQTLHRDTVDDFCTFVAFTVNQNLMKQEAQLSPSDRAMRLVSSNLANYHATVHAETTYTTSPDQTDGMKLEV